MTEDEKFISFMNRYFVFRKVRNVATKNIERLLKPVMGEDDEGVAAAEENTIEGIAKTLAAKKADADVAKPGIDATKKKVFIRKIDYPKVAISVYDPVKEGDAGNPQIEEVQEMARKYESFTVVPEEVTGPEIRLKKAIPPPEAIVKRGEKKIRIPKVKG